MASRKPRSRPRFPIDRIFKPFNQVIIPITPDYTPLESLKMAREFKGTVGLVGFVSIPPGETLSAATSQARSLRRKMNLLAREHGIAGSLQVHAAHNICEELREFTRADPSTLLILEWPGFFTPLGITSVQEACSFPCHLAILKGTWKDQPSSILVPIRGGPNSELALRFSLALPRRSLSVLHLPRIDLLKGDVETAFKGLARILPSLPEVQYEYHQVRDPADYIDKRMQSCDLVIAGMRSYASGDVPGFGPILDRLFATPATIVAVKSALPEPDTFTGPESEKAGARAISILVDKWFAENTYHASEFDDLEQLVALKKKQDLTISLALPALNEEQTIGAIIESVLASLVRGQPLLDEVILMDSNSSDRTRQVAASFGIPIHIHQETLPAYGARAGKGDALWKSLFVTRGDIVVWCDTDIMNFHPRFIYGVIGPLLSNPNLKLVKGFYQRPLNTGEMLQSTGGGRVTELTARPLINLFYPELSGVIQPLSGEYGGRRSALETLSFFSSYGVETGLLIDAFEKFGLASIAQVDLLERIHHNQPLEALSMMSFRIIQAVLRKLEGRLNQPLLDEVNKSMKLIRYSSGTYYLDVEEVAERDRPPMVEIPEYRQLWEK